MASLDKSHAKRIAKKLKAVIDKRGKAHDLALIYHDEQLVAWFGIRRGSRKSLGHGHTPADLHVSLKEALDLARCPMSREDWVHRMTDLGLIGDEQP